MRLYCFHALLASSVDKTMDKSFKFYNRQARQSLKTFLFNFATPFLTLDRFVSICKGFKTDLINF